MQVMAPSVVSGGFWCQVPGVYACAFPLKSQVWTAMYSSEVPEDPSAMTFATETPVKVRLVQLESMTAGLHLHAAHSVIPVMPDCIASLEHVLPQVFS